MNLNHFVCISMCHPTIFDVKNILYVFAEPTTLCIIYSALALYVVLFCFVAELL